MQRAQPSDIVALPIQGFGGREADNVAIVEFEVRPDTLPR
jgi:hypothetical protein